ncbi:hypothetical protein ABW286_20495 [Erwinia papayae]|uniref:Uncharacterized protein n=1 Tax=Erwinia papayae TaxID=206499 RepID=A0ABV3N6Q9_9GAMM
MTLLTALPRVNLYCHMPAKMGQTAMVIMQGTVEKAELQAQAQRVATAEMAVKGETPPLMVQEEMAAQEELAAMVATKLRLFFQSLWCSGYPAVCSRMAAIAALTFSCNARGCQDGPRFISWLRPFYNPFTRATLFSLSPSTV